jgi:hypothetical protein
MGKGKALVLGSSLLLAGTSMANSNDLFETNDLGAAKEVQCQILDINGVDDSTINFSPNELCCAYGSPTDFKKQDRKWKRQDRKRARQEKRKSK